MTEIFLIYFMADLGMQRFILHRVTKEFQWPKAKTDF